VVYNHFGPDGNYLHAYCPQFFNAKRKTPWGAAINFDGGGSRTVRDFYLHNALYWVEEYAFDGLRLDAVHAIRDDSDTHIVCEIARALRAGPGRERAVHLVLENDANPARFLGPCATAQWNDDLHHAAHVLATDETDGYYADYAERPLEKLGRALAEGFVYQGDPSAFRDGELRGEPSAQLPSTAFVSFLQTHDQVGNRALGERLHALGDPARERALLACLLLSPHEPMFFMGEEFAAATPFLYFCDFAPALAHAVAEGRRGEFARFAAFADPAARAAVPDPGSPDTFARSKLDWASVSRAPHRERLKLVRMLLYLRCSMRTLRQRIRLRGRAMEQDVPLAYLKRLDRLYEQWISSYSMGEVLVLETDRLDYINDVIHRLDVMQRIEAMLPVEIGKPVAC
jgi:maltooligosyltrehalose trehalohydrolase